MKISVNWLREYTDIDLPIDELSQKIGAQLGEVEETVDLGKKYQGIKVAKVVECKPHPNADKLKLCKIDGGGGLVQVVCGAPNVREGMLAAWLPPGSIVPATFDKDPLKLEAREIRREISNGMLASPHELGISDDHNGILELDKGKPGDDFAKVYGLDDHIIDIENKMFTHRPDCFGLLGVAREVSGIQHKKFVSPEWYLKSKIKHQRSNIKDLPLEVRNELPDLTPRFVAVAVKDVRIGPSPIEMQIKLSSVGIKPINNIVDITNLVMYLTGQPLHAYDYDKVGALSKSSPVLVVRKPKKAEKIKILGGKVIEPHKEAIMIATDKELIGFGGVIGGADTEVDGKTKNIILECANFDLYSVRKTSMIHGLFTDAVTRFSKGQSPAQNDMITAKTLQYISELSGGKQASEVLGADPKKAFDFHSGIAIKPAFINERLGLKLTGKEIAKLLRNVEFDVFGEGNDMVISAPFWRTDIEIPEDIVEEVGRLYGYDHLPLELPKKTMTPSVIDTELRVKQVLREKLSALGANEVLSYSFVHGDLLDKAGQEKDLAFKIQNALSPDLQYYRLSLVPSLLEKVHPNIKAGFNEFALFEIGKVHGKSETGEDGIPKEFGRVSLVYANSKELVGAPYYQARVWLDSLFDGRFGGIRYESLKNGPKNHQLFNQMLAPFDPERSALVYSFEKLLGVVGEYKSSVAKNHKLPQTTAGFELFLSPFAGDPALGYGELSKYPSVDQDTTLRTGLSQNFAAIIDALDSSIKKNKPKDVNYSVKCIDIFAKDEKYKNTTFRVSAYSSERTLTNQFVNVLLDKAAVDLKKLINAQRV